MSSVETRYPVSPLEPSLKGPGWFPRWVPTSDLELYQAEAAILNPIRPMISQHTVAGLNTICSLHEKVRTLANGEEVTVEMVTAMPRHKQTEKLKRLDADNYASIVCIHGFGGGVANWLPAWKAFATEHDMYAFDLPGFARSVRPKGVSMLNAQESLDWFMEHFAQWFIAMRIGCEEEAVPKGNVTDTVATSSSSELTHLKRPLGRRIIIVGHSFGGYLGAMFALKYPHLCDKLILADSWGIPHFVPPCKESDPDDYAFRTSRKVRVARWVFTNIGAGGVLRAMGPVGKCLLPKLRGDFGRSWAEYLDDPNHFYEYAYHCNAAHGSVGERGFVTLGITPHRAHMCLMSLVEKFPSFPLTTQQSSNTTMADTAAPRLHDVTVLYGSHSWMWHESVPDFVAALTARGIKARLGLVDRAGHQIISDNAAMFRSQVLDAIAGTMAHMTIA